MAKASQKIQAIRGMNDILPEQTPIWQFVEQSIQTIFAGHGYQEIRYPLLEKTELFARSIGEVTDIVEKEMYTFTDRNGESLTLRPEGTAGCVRAVIEHNLTRSQVQKLWYMGPMFRYERPQKGRYRQFFQAGAEVYGVATPDIDVELILMTARLWRDLGLHNHVELHLNSLGDLAARKAHKTALVEYFNDNIDKLDEDSKRRLQSNPLRILDSKNESMQALLEGAPKLLDYLDQPAVEQFEWIQSCLREAGIPFVVNPRLVRGLDYYSHTVFEWVTSKLGAQGAICGGGRYDKLVEELGGQATPAIGFAIGLDRLIALMQAVSSPSIRPVDIYFMTLGDTARQKGLMIAHTLRQACPTQKIWFHCGEGSFKSQFKKADKSQAEIAIVLGEDEVISGQVVVKYLREERPQETMTLEKLIDRLKQKGE